MDILEILKELKSGILQMIKEKFDAESDEIKQEVESHVEQSKVKLERWSLLLKEGAITKEDFLWLIESQRDLLQLASLRRLGISQIKLGHFKSKVISFVAETVFKFVF